jgi:hypothetical protein
MHKKQRMKTVLIILFLSISSTALCQTLITGTVADQNGAPIPGANIFIENTYDGTSSDAEGRFSFTSSEAGEHIVVVRFIGYSEYRSVVALAGKEIALQPVLTEEASHLDAVTISAGSFTAGEEQKRTIFKALDIATTAGATADIAGALNTLPGTQKVGESGRLFVRGGDGSETQTFIDGMVVAEAYGPSSPNAPSRGRFLPFMFKGTSFSTGGYSAEYGQALSSVLALDSKDESETTRTDIGLLSVGADVSHTQAWEGGSAAAKIQYTNLRPYTGLISQEIDWQTPPASLEGIVALRQKTGTNGMLKFYSNFSGSDFSLFQHDIDDYALTTRYRLKNGYQYSNLSYRTLLRDSWTIRSGISYTKNSNETFVNDIRILEDEKTIHGKTVVEGSIGNSIDLKTGAELFSRNYDQTYSREPQVHTFTENLSAVFVEGDWRASNRFMVRAAARFEYTSLMRIASVDPRISLAYKVNSDGQVSFAYGKFRQTPLNKFVKVDDDLSSEKAEHFILNYQFIKERRTFRVEAFYKRYDDLIKYESLSHLTNDGVGYAKGLEVFWRDNATFKGVDYWISYSLMDSERDYLKFPHAAVPTFVSKHNLSLVGKYFVRSLKSQLGATYSFTSGRPYHDPNSDTFHGSTTPVYQDLSVNWSYLPRPYIIVHLSCTNVPGFDNVFGYEFSDKRNAEGQYNGRAIRQPAPRFLFLGVFITLSKHKSINQLPTL